MTAIQSIFYPSDNLTIHTLSAGEKGGQEILFLHGKAFQAKTWKDLGTLELLAKKGCSAVALDLPGWGQSPEADFNAEQVVKSVIDGSEMKRPILVGPSMGGRIALEFALGNPQLVGGLILIGAVGIVENRSRLDKLPQKTLLVWGENDHISDPANGKLLHSKVVGSQLVIIPDTKHACYTEKPADFHNHILQFICS